MACPPHRIPPIFLPKFCQRQKQNPPSEPSKPQWAGLGYTAQAGSESHTRQRHLPPASLPDPLLGRSPWEAGIVLVLTTVSLAGPEGSDKVQMLPALVRPQQGWGPLARTRALFDLGKPVSLDQRWVHNGRQRDWKGPKSVSPPHIPGEPQAGGETLPARHEVQAHWIGSWSRAHSQQEP